MGVHINGSEGVFWVGAGEVAKLVSLQTYYIYAIHVTR